MKPKIKKSLEEAEEELEEEMEEEEDDDEMEKELEEEKERQQIKKAVGTSQVKKQIPKSESRFIFHHQDSGDFIVDTTTNKAVASNAFEALTLIYNKLTSIEETLGDMTN